MHLRNETQRRENWTHIILCTDGGKYCFRKKVRKQSNPMEIDLPGKIIICSSLATKC